MTDLDLHIFSGSVLASILQTLPGIDLTPPQTKNLAWFWTLSFLNCSVASEVRSSDPNWQSKVSENTKEFPPANHDKCPYCTKI